MEGKNSWATRSEELKDFIQKCILKNPFSYPDELYEDAKNIWPNLNWDKFLRIFENYLYANEKEQLSY